MSSFWWFYLNIKVKRDTIIDKSDVIFYARQITPQAIFVPALPEGCELKSSGIL